MSPNERLACWVSEKKAHKINWSDLKRVCRDNGFDLFRLNLEQSLESQQPFSVLLHKLTDVIASAIEGNSKSSQIIEDVEKYLLENPSITVIDPIANVRRILDRYVCYGIIRSTNLHKYEVFIPNFCEMTSYNVSELRQCLKKAGITYPFVSKAILGHGSKQAHEMKIIFNEQSLMNCKVPCVAQSFINHNASLYKIFLVGERHFFVERPSIKNFYTTDLEPITFISSEVSKSGSRNDLCILDPEDQIVDKIEPDPVIFDIIAKTLRKAFGMDLLGVDVVIAKSTGHYAIIDVNAYPGYDGFPNFFECLMECIKERTKRIYIEDVDHL